MLKVVGEVSNFACPQSGHWYFCLKDQKAQVRCVYFQGKQRAAHLSLTDGMAVIVHARLRLYEIRGEFQLAVEYIEPVGDGVLQQKFEALKSQLAKEGLFDQAQKKPLPTIARTVGIITSPTGAAIRDILTVLKRRFPAMAVIIYPSSVQGEEAAGQISQQIAIANERAECEVLIITRGGGSLEDLWPFNEEKVARAIAASRLPTISAVGHEVDVTISDFAADVRAPTPSVAAELVSPDQTVWQQRLNQLEKNLIQIIKNHLENYKQRIMYLKRCLRHPDQHLKNAWQQLDELDRRAQYAIQHQLEAKSQKLIYLSRTLETLNPLSTLGRGYSLLKRAHDAKIIQEASQVQIGEIVNVQLSKGQLTCIVQDRKLT
jgi:exodeoxyribonuclease VII large subunit